MSEFTSASSGIFRSEIPAQFFNEMKTYVVGLLQNIPQNKDWAASIDRIQEWTMTDIEQEVKYLRQMFPGVDDNCRYTILRATKTLHNANNEGNMCIRSKSLSNISLGNYLRDYVKLFTTSKDVSTREKFDNLRPSDRELIARDAFRHTLYSHVRTFFPEIVVDSKVNTISPDDSVSCAPSEVISHKPEPSSLSENLLRLHSEEYSNDQVDMLSQVVEKQPAPKTVKSQTSIFKEPTPSKMAPSQVASQVASRITSQVASRITSQVASHSQVASKRPAAVKEEKPDDMIDMIEVDVVSSTFSKASKRNSRFAREMKPKLNVKPVPTFFDDNGEQATLVSRF